MHPNDKMAIRPLPQAPVLGIGGVSEQLGLTPRALRYYEEKNLVQVRRDRFGQRVYDLQARDRLAWIASLRSAGLSLREIAEILKLDEHVRRAELASRMLSRRLRAVQAQAAHIQRAIQDLAAQGLRSSAGSAC
jgi:DNA-binding transcriptional MerR regulator